jgi:hypothetical protein
MAFEQRPVKTKAERIAGLGLLSSIIRAFGL